MSELSDKIAYITINPSGKFMKSAQAGFDAVGLQPRYLIHVNPRNRIMQEYKRYKLGVVSRFLLPKFKQHFGNKKSFSEETINIPIPVKFTCASLREDALVEFIKNSGITYLVNCGAGIFPRKVIDLPGLQIINAHAGALPLYRNMNVVEWALFNGHPVVGTIHKIAPGIDTGDILYQEELHFSGVSDHVSLRESAFDQVIRLAGKVVLEHSRGNIAPAKQDHSQGKNWYIMHSYFRNIIDKVISEKY